MEENNNIYGQTTPFFTIRATDIQDIGKNALEEYDNGDELSLIYIPIKEIAYKSGTGWGSYECAISKNEDSPPTFILCGTFSEPLLIGYTYRSDGIVKTGTKSKQFHTSSIERIQPDSTYGVLSFMASLPGVRFHHEILFSHFGMDALRVIQEEPNRIMQLCDDVDDDLLATWRQCVRSVNRNYGILSDIIALGIKPRQAKALYDVYGDYTMQKLREDPYLLMGKLHGYGFGTCEQIAKNLGLPPNYDGRLQAGITQTVKTLMINGSTRFRYEEVVSAAIDDLTIRMTYQEMSQAVKDRKVSFTYAYGPHKYKISVAQVKDDLDDYARAKSTREKFAARTVVFPIDRELVKRAMDTLCTSGVLAVNGDFVALKQVHEQETNIAMCLSLIKAMERPVNHDMATQIIDDICKEQGVTLEQKQREAVEDVCSCIGGAHIITGAAGCGKTFCINVALKALNIIYGKEGRYLNQVIVAPTGKAARVAQEATGIEAFTVHKLLQFHPEGGFQYNAQNRLDYNCVVVDESSMLDTALTSALLDAVQPNAKIVFMGDFNQLPSISPGNVLRDMIQSSKIQTTVLNVVKRQGKDSGIISNANRVIVGEAVKTSDAADFVVFGLQRDEQYIQYLHKYYDRLVQAYGLEQVQILTPMKKGLTGTHYLNYIMQQQFLGEDYDGPSIPKLNFDVNIDGKPQHLQLAFRIGDKVINTKNNYQAEWYETYDGLLYKVPEKFGITNGEIGTIVAIAPRKDEFGDEVTCIVVEFDEKYIIYDDGFDSLEHAYAITIHRSQGSEWKGVVVMLHPSHKTMIDRNLLYTAITRTKQNCFLLTDVTTMQYAVGNVRSQKRETGLIDKIHAIIQ